MILHHVIGYVLTMNVVDPSGPPPSEGDFMFPTLYKLNEKTGGIQHWTIFFDEASESIYTEYGRVGAKYAVSTSALTKIVPKVKRNLYEQAMLEMSSKYKKKTEKEGCVTDPSGVRSEEFFSTMQGKPWNNDPLVYPVFVMPKIDGVRFTCHLDDDENPIFLTRGKKRNPILESHFGTEAKRLIQSFDYPIALDGEVYIHGMLLQTINGIISTKTSVHSDVHLLKYHVFTYREVNPSDREVAEVRLNKLNRLIISGGYRKIRHVQAAIIRMEPGDTAEDMKEKIYKVAGDAVADGYEGGMIYKMGKNLPAHRKSEAYYSDGPTKNIFKLKFFNDEEGTVIGVERGKGKAAELAMITIEEDPDEFGNPRSVCTMRPTVDDETAKMWAANPFLIVGKRMTYRYFGRTEDGNLRHPNAVSIRDDL